MRTEDIREFTRRQPFEPFRLTLTDGRTYEVRHPDLIMVGRSTVVVGLPPEGVSEGVYDVSVTVDLLHIMQVEPLRKQPSRPDAGNGN